MNVKAVCEVSGQRLCLFEFEVSSKHKSEHLGGSHGHFEY